MLFAAAAVAAVLLGLTFARTESATTGVSLRLKSQGLVSPPERTALARLAHGAESRCTARRCAERRSLQILQDLTESQEGDGCSTVDYFLLYRYDLLIRLKPAAPSSTCATSAGLLTMHMLHSFYLVLAPALSSQQHSCAEPESGDTCSLSLFGRCGDASTTR